MTQMEAGRPGEAHNGELKVMSSLEGEYVEALPSLEGGCVEPPPSVEGAYDGTRNDPRRRTNLKQPEVLLGGEAAELRRMPH